MLGVEKKQEMSQANLISSIATLSKLTRKVTARKEILRSRESLGAASTSKKRKASNVN